MTYQHIIQLAAARGHDVNGLIEAALAAQAEYEALPKRPLRLLNQEPEDPRRKALFFLQRYLALQAVALTGHREATIAVAQSSDQASDLLDLAEWKIASSLDPIEDD